MQKKLWLYTIYILLICAILSVFYFIKLQDDQLSIIACDVGQGDGILIQRQETQIIIDGGRGSKMGDCLSRYMPFWDRDIELIVLTNPDLDHYEGLISVFRSFSVKNYLSSSLVSKDESFNALQDIVSKEDARIIHAYFGLNLNINGLSLMVLNPLKYEIEQTEKVNNYSIVTFLNYGKFDALFTGDIEDKASDELSNFPAIKNIEYLKVPHHGSKNGLSQKLYDVASPEISVISSGKKNSYGHPHQEVLDILQNTKVLRTDQIGDVVVKTDGNKYNIDR